MSNTKALETARKNLITLGKQYKSGQHVLIGQALDDIFQTENELAQLRKDLEEARAENGKLSALLAEKYEIYLQNCAEIDQLNIELEAMFQATVSVLGDNEHRGRVTEQTLKLCRNTVCAYLAAHPKETK